MAADLSIHALVEPATEADLAAFHSNTLGSKYFTWGATRNDEGVWSRIGGTPQVWIGEVSWLKAALSGDAEKFVPSFVQAVTDIIDEDLPTIDDALIERLREAHEAASNMTSYSTADWDSIQQWLIEHKGARAFTVSW